jgi:uncharacterized protein YbjT (DUF2867 family)
MPSGPTPRGRGRNRRPGGRTTSGPENSASAPGITRCVRDTVATMHILVTGATGYVGGRLLPLLEASGHRVRCLARRPDHLTARAGPATEVVAGDVLDRASLVRALEGIDLAYYLVHSMGDASGFEAHEAEGARNFAAAAAEARIGRIVYLGGLGDETGNLSPHLRSRHEVGRILRDSGVCTVELRTSIVIGSGSLSFEMIRALCEHLPVMITPRWVSVLAQPIAIQDLLDYLVQAMDVPVTSSVVVEIGGADQLSYAELMREYMRQRHLRRLMIRVPVLTPRLSSLWLGLVTPLYARVGRKLIESIKHPTVVRSPLAAQLFPIRPRSAAEAIRAALENEDREFATTRWFDAMSASGQPRAFGGTRFGPRLVDQRERVVDAPASACFGVIDQLGGEQGWLAFNSLWRLRGFLDLLIGGVGMRRGRPRGRSLRVGDALDFWRVEAIEPPRVLRLRAEMKVPGRAWLEFVVTPEGSGSRIRQTAMFDPVGVLGRAYWYGVYPMHSAVFGGMIAAIAARAADAGQRSSAPTAPTPTP